MDAIQEIIEINDGNDRYERISSLITYNNLSNHLINHSECNLTDEDGETCNFYKDT